MQYQKDIIIITAAGAKTWLRERLTPSSWGRMFGEAGIKGYKEKMDALRSVDDRIFEWVKDLHKLVKKMRQSAKAARYVDVAIYLSQINKRFQNVKSVGKEIQKLTDEDILPFELEHKQDLPSADLFSADDEDEDEDEEGLKSEAGLSDMKRRWVAKRLEHDMRAARKLAIKELLNRTESLVGLAQDKLNDLSSARASGDIGAYIKVIGQISQAQIEFQTYFMPVYKKYLEPLVLRAVEEKKKLEEAQTQSPDEVREALGLEPRKPQVEKIPEHQEFELDLPGGQQLSDPTPQEFELDLPGGQQLGDPTPPEASRRIKGPGDLLTGETPASAAPAPSPAEVVPEATIEEPEEPVKQYTLRPQEPGRQPGVWETYKTPEHHLSAPLVVEGPITQGPGKKPKKKKGPIVPTPVAQPTATKAPEVTAATHLDKILLKTAHQKFVIELFKAADQNDPYLISAMLVKYAGQIEELDLEKSLQLLAIAEGIINAS